MAIRNPSFEDPGTRPGEAKHWTLQTVTSLERIAGFGPDPHQSQENFERWTELALELDPDGLAIAFFDPLAEGYEDFEDAWDNDFYMTELPTGRVITAPLGGGAVEDMEAGWSNDVFLMDWSEVSSVTGVFDGELREDFEDLWRGNESYAWGWGDVIALAAMFDRGSQPVEDFENDWTVATTI